MISLCLWADVCEIEIKESGKERMYESGIRKR
jgi:hypothetical protein